MELEKIKKIILLVLFSLLLLLVLLVSFLIKTAIAADSVVIIGGWGSDKNPEELEYLQKNISGSIAIMPSRYWPLKESAADVLQQLKEKGMKGPLILIGHSWGGLIAREIDAENPGLVKKIVTIGTPNAGFWFAPWFVYKVGDQKSQTPLWLIAGVADEVVNLGSALNVGPRQVNDLAVFPLGHVELLRSEEVVQQIKIWLDKE
jgi:pimeloyl-ACP methyl ester carboxylesterase